MLRISKKVMILLVSLLWAVAGINILYIGIEAFVSEPTNLWIKILGIILVFCLFFLLIFKRVSRRTIARIQAKEGDKHRPWAILDLKGYAVMFFMIALGIIIRKSGVVNSHAIAVFYIGLSVALLSSALSMLLWVHRNKEIG